MPRSIKMPPKVKAAVKEIWVEWGRSLEYARAKSAGGLLLRVEPGQDPEELRKAARNYLIAAVDEELEGQ